MSQNFYDAIKKRQIPLATAIAKQIVSTEQLLAALPVLRTFAGGATSYKREKTLIESSFRNPSQNVPGGASTIEQVTVPVRHLTVDAYSDNDTGNLQESRKFQAQKAAKSLGRKLADAFINGSYASGATITPDIAGVTVADLGPGNDSSLFGPGSIRFSQSAGTLSFRGTGDARFGAPVAVAADGTFTILSDNPSRWITVTVTFGSLPTADAESVVYVDSPTDEVDGLRKLCAPSQIRSSEGVDGDALGFEIIDELLAACKIRDNRVLLMSPSALNKLRSIERTALGGTHLSNMQLGSFSNIVTYQGVPILESDYVYANESKGANSNLTSVYCVSLGQEGFGMAVQEQGGMPAEVGGKMMNLGGLFHHEVGFTAEDSNRFCDRYGWRGNAILTSDLACSRASELIL